MRTSLLWLALTTTLASPVWAAERTQSAASDSQVVTSRLSDTGVNDALVRLSDEEQSLARQWMLSDDDWVKYKTIMAGPRGIWSPGLDPITALGVMETDPAERRRYAEIWMRMEVKRTELELAFEVERMAVSQQVLAGRPVVNNDRWVEQWNAQQTRRTHDVMLFVDPECVDSCRQLFEEVLASTGTGDTTHLNVYFPSGTSADAIGHWAQTLGIDPDRVTSRKVTLNFDRGEYARYAISQADLPAVRVVNLSTGEVQTTFKRW